jgi:hypothetical protein
MVPLFFVGAVLLTWIAFQAWLPMLFLGGCFIVAVTAYKNEKHRP